MSVMAMYMEPERNQHSAGCLEWQNGFDAAAKHKIYVGIIPKV